MAIRRKEITAHELVREHEYITQAHGEALAELRVMTEARHETIAGRLAELEAEQKATAYLKELLP